MSHDSMWIVFASAAADGLCCTDEDEDGEEDAQSDDDRDEDEEDNPSGAEDGGTRSKRRRKHAGVRRAEPEIQRVNKRTSRSVQQEQEALNGPEELPNLKPMMELEAGKNVWYQAYVLKESLNEAKVRIPRKRGAGCSGQGFQCAVCSFHASYLA